MERKFHTLPPILESLVDYTPCLLLLAEIDNGNSSDHTFDAKGLVLSIVGYQGMFFGHFHCSPT
jgi:hypothetical protein